MNPLILLSPAKTMRETDLNLSESLAESAAALCEQAIQMISSLKTFSIPELQILYKSSEDIATQNFQRYQSIEKNRKYAAITLYRGEVYKSFDFEKMKESQRNNMGKHIVIISALYGLIPAFTSIAPYRLDMHCKSDKFPEKSLLTYWKKTNTQTIQAMIQKNKFDVIFDLASKEFTQTIDFKAINIPKYDFEFWSKAPSGFKQISTIQKQMRGQMANALTLEIPKNLKDIENLSIADFKGQAFRNNTFIFHQN
ncbi:MAG: YaaA family protein [Chitinophagales bacterium]|jgi:hypothetical protein|nr:YaaA family protein [Chitinophagales bacterium]